MVEINHLFGFTYKLKSFDLSPWIIIWLKIQNNTLFVSFSLSDIDFFFQNLILTKIYDKLSIYKFYKNKICIFHFEVSKTFKKKSIDYNFFKIIIKVDFIDKQNGTEGIKLFHFFEEYKAIS